MPLRLVEALRGEELLTATDVDGAFPTLRDFVQWATDSAGGLTEDEQSQAGIALERLRSETDTDVGLASELPAAPEPKAIPWFVSAAPIPAQVGQWRKRLPNLPSASAASTVLEPSVKAPRTSKDAAIMEMIYAVYLEVAEAGTKWLDASAMADGTRKELILRPMLRHEPKSLRTRLSSLRRWRGFAEAMGQSWPWHSPPTLAVGSFLTLRNEDRRQLLA